MQKNWKLAIILAIVVGGLGIHRYYLHERLFPGLFYTLLFWTGVSSVISLIEGIWWLLMGEEEFHRRYHTVSSSVASTTSGRRSDREEVILGADDYREV